MINVAIGNIFYNSARDFNRLVDTIPKGSISTFLGIDGIYSYNFCKDGNLSGLSTDRSRLILKEELEDKKGIKVHIEDCPNETQVTKRNRYLELCSKYGIDCLIIIDSDEYFDYTEYDDPQEQWSIFKNNFEHMTAGSIHNVYSIGAIRSDGLYTTYPRVWNKPNEMRYFRNSHYHFLNINWEYERYKENPHIYTQKSKAVIQGLVLNHDHTLRNDLQMKMRKEYQGYNMRYEEIVQRNIDHETAHKIAMKDPVTRIISKCDCPKCIIS